MRERFKKIFFWLFKPKMGKLYFIRVAILAGIALLFFGVICEPMILDGESMEPNYRSGTLNFCWTPTYWFREPERGEVVVLRYAGQKVLLLKRIVALPGDTVEFRNGDFYLNGIKQSEPYVKFKKANWNLKPRKIGEGYYYVVGDNRSMPIYQHKFGEIRQERLEGALLL